MAFMVSPSGVPVNIYTYEDFQGIDSSRDPTALDTGKKQHLIQIENGFADWRGALTLDPGVTARTPGERIVNHLTFFGRDLGVWAQKDGGGITLRSERFFDFGAGHQLEEVFPVNSVVTSASFNHKVVFATRGQDMAQYNGLGWERITPKNTCQPAYIATCQRRLVTAGHPGRGTIVDISRVDEVDVFTDDEDEKATQVTKASDIDIRNIIGTSDEIRGLGVFEKNKLVVFTYDQAIVYDMHPDYTRWQINERANVNVGTISHNTVCSAGSDLLFCARDGVYSIRRSVTNGVAVFSIPMSSKIDQTYRALIASVPDTQMINAYFDHDNGQYNIFFPQTDGLCERLTMTTTPVEGGEAKWSTSKFLQARCGRTLGGVTLLGTPGGVFTRGRVESLDEEFYPTMTVWTPELWQGALNQKKESAALILQASGKGTVEIAAFNEEGESLGGMTINIDDTAEDDDFTSSPLSRQYERPFARQYRGIRFRLTVTGRGLVRIIGFAILVKAKPQTPNQ
jgi:hypothetical protein